MNKNELLANNKGAGRYRKIHYMEERLWVGGKSS
jgi:hypothetical protein